MNYVKAGIPTIILLLWIVLAVVDGLLLPTRKEVLNQWKKSLVASCFLALVPSSPSFAAVPEYRCPQSFSFPSLGVQNVVQASPSKPISPQGTPSTKSSSGSKICPTVADSTISPDYTVQGLVYLPSSLSKDMPIVEEGSLIITITSIDKPSIVLAGGQIPLEQIPSFPLAFSLSKFNLLHPPASKDQLEVEWDNRVLYAPYDLVVTAQLRTPTRTLQGQGYCKLLSLPSGEEDFSIVRAAASVRLQ